MTIFYSVLVIGTIGLLFGLLLSYAGEKLKVETDPRIDEVNEVLPGANCAACGFTGCAAFAEAVVSGKASTSGCPVGGEEVAKKVSAVLGVEPSTADKEVAFVKCNGTCYKAKDNYQYYGMDDCNAAALLAGGTKKGCSYGCMGLGSCVKKCEFDAIHIVDGIAKVDKEKCVGCKACVVQCPLNLIDMVPEKINVHVACNSNDKGKAVKENCEVGCIGCKKCEKECPFDAIHVENFLAKVDYSKCKNCTKCVKVCPTEAIINQRKKVVKKVEPTAKKAETKKAETKKEEATTDNKKEVPTPQKVEVSND